MRLTLLVTIAALGLAVASPASAAGFKVIANPSVKASDISTDDLRGVFLATRTSLPDGTQVEPVLARTGAAHEIFVRDIGKTGATLSTYYRSLVFTGKGTMPKVCGSDAEVIAYVAKTKGAIGYVSAEARAPGTKTLGLK
jgi:ABC-type phosphate transport system substrate-binding protein